MTREEAKTWLIKLYARADITDEYGDMEDMQPYEEAVNMAIETMESYDIERQKEYNEGFNACFDSLIPNQEKMYERGKADVLKVIEDIKAEISEYEKTCKVWSANQLKDDVKRCTSCINGTFGRINEIFDRHLGSEVQADENWID